MILESKNLEDVTILNVYVPDSRISKYIEWNMIEPQGEIDKATVTSRDLNTGFSIIDGTSLPQMLCLEVKSPHKLTSWRKRSCWWSLQPSASKHPILLEAMLPTCKWTEPIKTSPLILLPGPASRTEIKGRRSKLSVDLKKEREK